MFGSSFCRLRDVITHVDVFLMLATINIERFCFVTSPLIFAGSDVSCVSGDEENAFIRGPYAN